MPKKNAKAAPAGPKPGELPVTYADMVTLLLTFFVFLMTMANFDVMQLQDFFQAMGAAFGMSGASGAGVLIGGAAMSSDTADLGASTQPENSPANAMVNLRAGADTPGTGKNPTVALMEEKPDVPAKIDVSQEAQEQFEETALELGETTGVQAEVTNQGLKITLEEDFARFTSGSSDFPRESVPKLRDAIGDQLSGVISDGFEIMVTGHTDNVPLGPATRARFTDNRGLATERANNVLRIFEGLGVPPRQISAAGYGAHKPIADNSTNEGRGENRRIEILVKYKEFSEMDWQSASGETPEGAPPANGAVTPAE